jgi:hypothetical protein
MAFPVTSGILDQATNTYQAPNTGTWANLTTWGSWTSWINQPAAYFTVASTPQDRGQLGYFNLHTSTDVTGNIKYEIYTSTTADFADANVTITNVAPGTSNVSAFYGQHYAVVANVSTTGTRPELRSMTITSTDQRLELTFNDLVSSSLAGNVAQRYLPLTRSISRVLNTQITCTDTGNAAATTDTTRYYTETPIFPAPVGYIVNKGTQPTVCFREVANGTLTNATFDAVLKVLPEQYMDTVNLNVR